MEDTRDGPVDLTPSQQSFLEQSRIPIRLSCILPNGFPLVVSLWYIYQEGKVLCATSKSSKIVSYLQQNDKVGFEIAPNDPPYCGLRGYGTVELDEDEDLTLIRELYSRYFSNTDSRLYSFLTQPGREEVVIAIDPRQIFDWDFSQRMQDARPRHSSHRCP